MPEQSTCDISGFFGAVDDSEVFLAIGGLLISVRVAMEAREILQTSRGLMVRQPLSYYQNPLAKCNYHAEAAPYREQYYLKLVHQGHRGAAAPPTTKLAFMHAIKVRSDTAMTSAPLVRAMPLAAEAYEAMTSDFSYVEAMSKMALSILAKQEQWSLKSSRSASPRKLLMSNRYNYLVVPGLDLPPRGLS